ncbi:MAG: hypothetical protein HDR26_06485 [Lachnospiraceae bacterium]|nr:hypothetical protein [Lachnospiraceae bacterium]
MERKQKNILLSAAVYLVIFIVYNLIVFMVFKNYNDVFWISYGFMIAAFLLHILCVFLIFKNTSVKAVFFGIPLLSFSVYFVCAEFFCSFVFMIFKTMANAKLALTIQALLLCAFIIIAIISIMARDTVQSVNDKIKGNVSFIKGLNVDVEMLMQRSTAPDVTASLKKLSETIKYSDPMSNSIVAVQEQMIMQYMTELRSAFDAGDMALVKDICGKIELLFIERNKKLMVSK